MGQNPQLDVRMKPTVHLYIAVAYRPIDRISKGVWLVSKPACELHYNQHKGAALNAMTVERIAGNQHWCGRCMLFFSSRYNLDRHQRRIKTCRFNDNSATPRKIVDVLTRELRYRTPNEQRELARMRKKDSYWDIW